jgi:hypothetical protein
MPVYSNRIVVEVACGVKAFLNLKLGVTRSELPEPENSAEQRRQIRQLRQALESKDRRIARLERKAGSVNPENLVWIFGTARTGSTWLGSMLEELEDWGHWREPYVGALFGNLYYRRPESHRRSPHYILGRPKKTWLGSVRSFVLEGAAAKFPGMGAKDYLAVKEPHGSIGAPIMMEALPESRMIFLVRDPRDVAASALDARKKGSWVYEKRSGKLGGGEMLGDASPETIVKERAETYVRDLSKVKDAYEAHPGRKVLVRYEDLRADTFNTMKSIFAALEILVNEEELVRAIEKHAFESIPEEKKGQGKFYRKASPGGWQEDLTPEQAKIVEEITAPLLEEFYGRSLNTEVRESKDS